MQSRNAYRIPYKFHLFVLYDCHSFLVMSKLKESSEVYLEPSWTSKRFQCICSMSGYGSHVPPIAFEVPNCLKATWTRTQHVRNKMPTTNGYRWPEKTNHFFKSSNLLSIGVPHKFHLFVSYDCYSYHRIEFDVMCSV